MTAFDAVAGGILALSAVLGLARGATREVTTLAAFALSLVLAVVLARFTAPLVGQAIHIAWLAKAVAMLAVFVLAYVVLRTLGGSLTKGIRGAGLSGLDRALGLGIGLGRGVVVIGVIGMLIAAAIPAERMPHWISQARLYPLTERAGAALRSVAPKGLKMTHDLAPMLALSGPLPPGPLRHPPLAVVVETPQ